MIMVLILVIIVIIIFIIIIIVIIIVSSMIMIIIIGVVCDTPPEVPENAKIQFGVCSGSYGTGVCPIVCNAGYVGAINLVC